MTWYLALKLLVVLFFLIMFIRRPSLVWGVGLLTVTTAVLLDTVLGTFDRQALEAELGFFYFVVAGSLFAGAAFWLWGLLTPLLRTSGETAPTAGQAASSRSSTHPPNREPLVEGSIDGFDPALLRTEIVTRFGREDVMDLLFDLEIPENEVTAADQNMNELIDNTLRYTQEKGQLGALALAVERILTPLPAEYLPRLEKITAESPPTLLRQYLLAHYSLEELQNLTAALGIDWEQLDAGAKREKVRSLLQYLYRRNRIGELVDLMQDGGGA